MSAGTGFSQNTSSGGSSFAISNILYVAENGDDGTAVVGDISKPYATLAQANTTAASGDLVYVFPGAYSGSNLGKDGVNWYFSQGCVITGGNIFTDSGSAMSFSVFGEGSFNASASICTASNASSNIFFELYSGSITAVTGRAFYARSGAIIKALLHGTISHVSAAGVYEALIRSDNAGAGVVGGKIYISGSGSLSSEGFIAQCKQGGGHNGVISIKLDGGINVPTAANANHRCVFEMNGGNLYVDSNISITPTSAYGLPSFRFEGACGEFVINGNITSSATGLLFSSAVASTILIKGSIVATQNMSIGAGALLTISGDIYTTVAATPSLSISGGTARINNCIIKNNDANAASHVITKSGGTLIVNGATLVSSGAGESINAGAAQNAIVYSGVANTAVNVNVTQQVSTLIVDVNVQ